MTSRPVFLDEVELARTIVYVYRALAHARGLPTDLLHCKVLGRGVVQIDDGRYWERAYLSAFDSAKDVVELVSGWVKILEND